MHHSKSIVALGLCLAIVAGSPGLATAQTTSEDLSATNGDAASLGTGNASAAPGSVTRGSGGALLAPDGTYRVTEVTPPVVSVSGTNSPPEVVYTPAPVTETVLEPAAEPVVTEGAVEPAASDMAVATVTDLDGDNYDDALEIEIGLDPANPDGDGDGVADGDEITIYVTDPFAWDTDGDGIADGEEIFSLQTDPLAWDSNGDGVADGQATELANTAIPVETAAGA